jgi:SAM-dependent methyltransferase
VFEKRYLLRLPKIALRSVRHLLGHAVFQLRKTDEQGGSYSPRGYAKLSLELNRAFIERGRRAPWMWSAERCQQFWATLEPGVGSNAPNSYAAKPTEIVDFMHHLWGSDVDRADKVLEIGCNAGANLDRLRQLGYSSLSGVEINPHAIAELSQAFPELRGSMTVHTGRIEDVLPSIGTGGVDVVFAMAVLHHIHPSSNRVFAEMVRVAAHHVCVIEPEQVSSQYIFCRDYSRVFEALGCQQLRVVEINRSSLPEVAEAYHGYTARLFRVPGA